MQFMSSMLNIALQNSGITAFVTKNALLAFNVFSNNINWIEANSLISYKKNVYFPYVSYRLIFHYKPVDLSAANQ